MNEMSVSASELNGRAGSGGAPRASHDEKSLAAWEVLTVVASAMIAAWVIPALVVVRARFILIPVVLAFAYMIASILMRGESARELGFRLDNFWRAARILLPPTLIVAVTLILWGWLGGSLNFRRWRGGRDVLEVPTLGIEWGFVQQFALQCFINRRAQILFGTGLKSIVLVAAVFALLHFPNPALTLATFAAGLLWAYAYQREPNIWALAISHGLMTWVLISTVPADLLNNLRVGYKYLT